MFNPLNSNGRVVTAIAPPFDNGLSFGVVHFIYLIRPFKVGKYHPHKETQDTRYKSDK